MSMMHQLGENKLRNFRVFCVIWGPNHYGIVSLCKCLDIDIAKKKY